MKTVRITAFTTNLCEHKHFRSRKNTQLFETKVTIVIQFVVAIRFFKFYYIETFLPDFGVVRKEIKFTSINLYRFNNAPKTAVRPSCEVWFFFFPSFSDGVKRIKKKNLPSQTSKPLVR